ncbi:Hypothetical protein AA314_00707 [Archangium gephyra]|uniref:Uncharacterized protein n=1 Tax=Archangium gephyra TaxID=48 RepID=A0AAC8Q1E0_9BACT|nr:Hypothetical protein AA314_00707 [Archangium gephyra]
MEGKVCTARTVHDDSGGNLLESTSDLGSFFTAGRWEVQARPAHERALSGAQTPPCPLAIQYPLAPRERDGVRVPRIPG